MTARARFISLEGGEGTGKSTQARMLVEALNARGLRAMATAEPGGTELGRAIRALLLDTKYKGMDAMTELLLYNAARREHIKALIEPALSDGITVVTDRFSDSTVAYQCYGRGIEKALVHRLDEMATGGMRPDLTVLLDIDVRVGLARNKGASKTDRFEQEELAFHERVREGFHTIMKAEPGRVRLVDASMPLVDVHSRILELALGA